MSTYNFKWGLRVTNDSLICVLRENIQINLFLLLWQQLLASSVFVILYVDAANIKVFFLCFKPAKISFLFHYDNLNILSFYTLDQKLPFLYYVFCIISDQQCSFQGTGKAVVVFNSLYCIF